MGKPKRAKATPAGRVLRTSTEIADWAFALQRRRTALARLAHGEAMCAEILAPPASDPRRRLVPKMRALLAAARSALEQGR